MLLKKPTNWSYSEENAGVLFFAERINELTYNHSLSTYKPPVLIAPTLCEEALAIALDLKDDDSFTQNFICVFDELSTILKNDKISKILIPFKINELLITPKVADHKITNLDIIILRLKILTNILRSAPYIEQLKKELIKNIKLNKKMNIDLYSKNFVAALISTGYSKHYIREQLLKIIYNESQSPDEAIDQFFNILNHKPFNYRICFPCDTDLSNIKDALKVFQFEVKSYPEDFSEVENSSILSSIGISQFMTFNVTARDPYTAVNIAQKAIEKAFGIYKLFQHRESFKLHEIIYVIHENKLRSISASDNPYSILLVPDYKPEKARSHVLDFLKIFKMEHDSFIKFDRVVEIHRTALENKSYENQLLNLWTCYEILAVDESKQSIINRVLKSIDPFIENQYLSSLIKNLVVDIFKWNRRYFYLLMKLIPDYEGSLFVERMAWILALEEHEGIRDQLYSQLEKFPLLKFRVFELHEKLKSKESILHSINTHKQRVDWQLKRIYRSRNNIVHRGQTNVFLPSLIENAHEYLDVFIYNIIYLIRDNRKIESIEQAIDFTRLAVQLKRNYLTSNSNLDRQGLSLLLKFTH